MSNKCFATFALFSINYLYFILRGVVFFLYNQVALPRGTPAFNLVDLPSVMRSLYRGLHGRSNFLIYLLTHVCFCLFYIFLLIYFFWRYMFTTAFSFHSVVHPRGGGTRYIPGWGGAARHLIP